jgi:hypothetical protein
MESPDPPPGWLRVLVRIDFIAAVALTVVAPLALTVSALPSRHRGELGGLLRYWRASSLLMATVYLLADARRIAFPAGIAARLALAGVLWSRPLAPAERTHSRRWRWLAGGYGVLGALASLPLLRGSLMPTLPASCAAYLEPPREYAALLHPTVSRRRLGDIGVIGLGAFVIVALAEFVRAGRKGRP